MGWVDSILTHTFDVWDMSWERWDVGDDEVSDDRGYQAYGKYGYIY